MKMLKFSLNEISNVMNQIHDIETEHIYVDKVELKTDDQDVGFIQWDDDTGNYFFKPNKNYFKL